MEQPHARARPNSTDSRLDRQLLFTLIYEQGRILASRFDTFRAQAAKGILDVVQWMEIEQRSRGV